MKWSDLALPWQACWEEAWAAWLAGSLFIGAVIVNGGGRIVGRGRNHINDSDAPSFQVRANQLAHAELNALLTLAPKPADVHSYQLYSLVEPCPLCLGAIYMSGVRAIHFAARDPWAGSVNLLGTTPYLSAKPVRAYGPDLPVLETAVVAMETCFELLQDGAFPASPNRSPVIACWRVVLPGAVELGERVAVERLPARWRVQGEEAPSVFDHLMGLM